MLKCCPFNKIYFHRERVKIQMLLFTRQLLLSEIPETFQASSDASKRMNTKQQQLQFSHPVLSVFELNS